MNDLRHEQLLVEYQANVELWKHDDDLRQKRTSNFLTVNAALLVFVGSVASLGADVVPALITTTVVALFAITICNVWKRSLVRAALTGQDPLPDGNDMNAEELRSTIQRSWMTTNSGRRQGDARGTTRVIPSPTTFFHGELLNADYRQVYDTVEVSVDEEARLVFSVPVDRVEVRGGQMRRSAGRSRWSGWTARDLRRCRTKYPVYGIGTVDEGDDVDPT